MQEPTREIWRGIPGHEASYEVSNHGRIRSLTRTVPRGTGTLSIQGRIIRTCLKSSGYLHFKLSVKNRGTYPMVHQCVAAAFIGPYPPSHVINHKNGCKTDNRVENLEYVTASENLRHALDHGLSHHGIASSNAKLTEAQVHAIRAAQGERTAQELAAQYGVSPLYIPLIWRRRRWTRLPEQGRSRHVATDRTTSRVLPPSPERRERN